MDDRDLIKQRWYSTLLRANQETKAVDPLASTLGQLTVEQAYEVQFMLTENKIAKGERIIGWKVGATSHSVMDQLNIEEPVFGCMTSSSDYSSREVKVSGFCKLAIEGEIAFVMKKPLRGPGVTNSDVMTATEGVMGAVELVDCKVKDWNVAPAEAIADNALHAGVILGSLMRPIAGFDLRREGVFITNNGRLLASACGVEALGNPVNVVSWLANRLAAFDREVRPGEIVLTGSLTNFFFVQPGDVMDIKFSRLGDIQFAVMG